MSRVSLHPLVNVAIVMLGAAIVGVGARATAEPPRDPGRLRLLLPPVIYAAPGIETNLYLDNVVLALDLDDYAFDVICEKGKQLAERWAFTPAGDDEGEYALEVLVRDEANAVVARGRSLVRVAPKAVDPPREATLLLVGDSFTEYAIYPRQLLELDAADEHLRLTLIGSRGAGDGPPTDEVRHEGYRGWSARSFVTMHGPLARSGTHQRPETGSPFVYASPGGGYELDFARYCGEFNGGAAPDLILIQLVTNDVFRADDDTIGTVVAEMIEHLETLIAEFHRVRSGTRIGVVLTSKGSRSQDGFRNYVGERRQTAWQFRRNVHFALERMVGHFANREAEHVYLVPSYLNVDTAHHFPTWASPRNARSSEDVVRVNNGTHPSAEGYQQIADAFYCWIKAVTGAAANN